MQTTALFKVQVLRLPLSVIYLLNIYLDKLNNLSFHCKYVKDRVSKLNNILKAFLGTSLGKEKETLLTTFKAVGRSIFNYRAPIWSPTLSDSNWKTLQTAQITLQLIYVAPLKQRPWR